MRSSVEHEESFRTLGPNVFSAVVLFFVNPLVVA